MAALLLSGCGGGGGGGSDPNAACKATVKAKESLGAGASYEDAAQMVPPAGSQLGINMSGMYRDNLAQHPGCSARATFDGTSEPLSPDNEATNVPSGFLAGLSGYSCSAAGWDQPNEDTKKPIVILAHGNQSGVPAFLEYYKETINGSTVVTFSGVLVSTDPKNAAKTGREMLVSKLLAGGYRVYSWDGRAERVQLTDGNSTNAATMDHGWSVPILESLIKGVINEFPGRKISLVGHSTGATALRDALRRLYVEYKASGGVSVNPFTVIKDAIWLSAPNHGMASGAARCATRTDSPTMAMTVACELGDRDAYAQTYFHAPLNGPEDVFSTPCADGDYAFGDHNACGGNVIHYTTVTMADPASGALHDEVVSQASARLDMEGCVDNELITTADYDTSGYFFLGQNGANANHLGSSRSDAGMNLILSKLAD